MFGEGLAKIDGFAFDNCTTVKQVWFRGDKPTFGSEPFRSWANWQTRFYAPKYNETWEDYAALSVTGLNPTEKNTFNTTYPEEPMALGKFNPPGSQTQWYCLWVPSELPTILIIK